MAVLALVSPFLVCSGLTAAVFYMPPGFWWAPLVVMACGYVAGVWGVLAIGRGATARGDATVIGLDATTGPEDPPEPYGDPIRRSA